MTNQLPQSQPLPVPLTSFVGRAREVAEVRRLLSVTRLLTLTGPGGIGKTRLALETVQSSGDAAFVDLAPHSDGGLVPAAVAAALGVREQSRVSLLHSLVTALMARPAVLILDNCEHLVTACSELADQLGLRTISVGSEPSVAVIPAAHRGRGGKFELVADGTASRACRGAWRVIKPDPISSTGL